MTLEKELLPWAQGTWESSTAGDQGGAGGQAEGCQLTVSL